MKRTIIILAAITAITATVNAQQLPLYNQYMMNKFLLNPAVAGSYQYTPIQLAVRNQWVGIKGAPATQSISGHAAPFKGAENMGIGGYVFNDKFGPVNSTGISAAYSYTLSLSNSSNPSFFGTNQKLAMGLSLSGIFHRVNMDEIEFYEENDIVDTKATDQHFVPDAGFGLYYYTSEYYAGLSVGHLLSPKMKFGDSETGKSLSRNYFLNLGYNFDLDSYIKDICIEPSVLLKMTEFNNPMQLDINVKAKYKDNLWAGLSYRTTKTLIVFIGANYDRYFLGYSFDWSFSPLMKNTAGSHELMLGAKLNYKPGAKDRAFF